MQGALQNHYKKGVNNLQLLLLFIYFMAWLRAKISPVVSILLFSNDRTLSYLSCEPQDDIALAARQRKTHPVFTSLQKWTQPPATSPCPFQNKAVFSRSFGKVRRENQLSQSMPSGTPRIACYRKQKPSQFPCMAFSSLPPSQPPEEAFRISQKPEHNPSNDAKRMLRFEMSSLIAQISEFCLTPLSPSHQLSHGCFFFSMTTWGEKNKMHFMLLESPVSLSYSLLSLLRRSRISVQFI